jgi:serine/threonine-protein kinase RsbT
MATITARGEQPLRNEHDIVLCRQTVRHLAKEAGFSLVDQTKFATSASDPARNALIYGGGGELKWESLLDGIRRGVRLSFEDHGPGIPDLEKALTDGWSSGTGLGLGLTGARRLVNEFELHSTVGVGTRVMIARWK